MAALDQYIPGVPVPHRPVSYGGPYLDEILGEPPAQSAAEMYTAPGYSDWARENKYELGQRSAIRSELDRILQQPDPQPPPDMQPGFWKSFAIGLKPGMREVYDEERTRPYRQAMANRQSEISRLNSRLALYPGERDQYAPIGGGAMGSTHGAITRAPAVPPQPWEPTVVPGGYTTWDDKQGKLDFKQTQQQFDPVRGVISEAATHGYNLLPPGSPGYENNQKIADQFWAGTSDKEKRAAQTDMYKAVLKDYTDKTQRTDRMGKKLPLTPEEWQQGFEIARDAAEEFGNYYDSMKQQRGAGGGASEMDPAQIIAALSQALGIPEDAVVEALAAKKHAFDAAKNSLNPQYMPGAQGQIQQPVP